MAGPTATLAGEKAVTIERILVRDVLAFAERHADAASRGDVVPISMLRAAAHATNPRADGDDVALLVAMNGERCVGYVGFMPGFIKQGEGLDKFYWYSTWYAGEEGQRIGAGGMLLLASLSLGYDIVGADLAEETVEFYHRLRFQSLGPLPYFLLGLDRLDPLGAPWQILRKWLARRGRVSRGVDTVFLTCRKLTKAILYRTLIRFRFDDLDIREVPSLPDDVLIGNDARVPHFHRDVATVRWALSHPWVTDRADRATRGFAFSDRRELVRFVVLEISATGTATDRLGHVVVSIFRDRGLTTVKVLDRFLRDRDQARVIAAAGLTYARRFRADRLLLPEQAEAYLRGVRRTRLLFRRRHRLYFCHPRRHDTVLPEDLSRIRLDFCDGDTPFT